MAEPLIRPATPADLNELLAIETDSFPAPHWDAETFFLYDTLVAEVEGRLAGLIVTRRIYDGDTDSPAEIEILNLAVAPAFRRTGIASALLRSVLRNPGIFFLEVRESNLQAQALYQKFDFAVISRRPDYYENPAESALVMKMKRC